MKDGRSAQVKPASVKWKSGINQLVESCMIELPLYPYLKNNLTATDIYSGEKECVFEVGGRVSVWVGYNGDNRSVFEGFIAAINYGERLEIICEGFAFLLKDKIFTKSYRATKLKTLLADLTQGLDIVLSDAIPDLTIKSVTFNNVKSMDVLEWLKKELLCSVVFRGNNLYAGASPFGEDYGRAKLQLGWNVAKDDNFKRQPQKTDIQINIIAKDGTGKTKRLKSGQTKFKSVKDIKVKAGLDEKYLKECVERLQREYNTEGRQEGKLSCFLVPYFVVGMIAEITDKRYPERNGNYFVQAIEGSFDTGGGRQILTLKNYGDDK
jgi:hypothetical protein